MNNQENRTPIEYRGEIVAYVNEETKNIKILNKKMFFQMKADPDCVEKYKNTAPKKYEAKPHGTVKHPKKYRLGTKNYMKNL